MGTIIERLSENIVGRDLSKEGAALRDKWGRTGLLEGMKSERERDGMCVLLENQAKQLLKEISAMSTGDVEGFAAVAFPLVRRVFGGLLANDLVSVQPMSLPSGLIFFLDFTFTDTKNNAGAVAAASLYGGNVVGSQITGGVKLDGMQVTTDLWDLEKSAYSLNNGYSSPTASVSTLPFRFLAMRSGSGIWQKGVINGGGAAVCGDANYVNLRQSLIMDDPDLSGSIVAVYSIAKSTLSNLNSQNLSAIYCPTTGTMAAYNQVRRLTRVDPLSGSNRLLIVFATHNSGSEDTNANFAFAASQKAAENASAAVATIPLCYYPITDAFTAGGALGSVVGTTPWGLEATAELAGGTGYNIDIPEIDIKVDSIAVTAITKKLKAKWSPELGQDLNAYHNLDAEVELTIILSEQIALEIDQEILNDLTKLATAGLYYWSRKPGKFVRKTDGYDITNNGANLPDFTGTVSEWYETLVETVNDVSAQIHRKTLRGGANFLVTSPEVANVLEMTAGFRASITHDDDTGMVGAVKTGSLTKKWDVYVDPYFPRNLILIGRKGSSFLESGYVYAPYVPLQVTPTIFGVEDFVPRKGVMTRYAKQMVRPDMYGLCVVMDLLGG